jgi:hypothetical protein
MKPNTLIIPAIAGVVLAIQLAAASAAVLTNDTFIGPLDGAFDGEDLIVSNCTVTVDGPHGFASLLLGDGATLTHPYYPGPVTNLLSVTNEVHSFADTNLVVLLNSNALTATIVVMDEGGTLIYTNDLDYVLSDEGGGMIGLQRTTTSTIPDGSSVWVSYDAVAGIGSPGLNLAVTDNVQVVTGAAIAAMGQGYRGGIGPGAGGSAGSPPTGSGAGYGGYGGISASNALGGLYYGSIEGPTMLGSGGGMGANGSGGPGGGAIRLNIGGSLRLDGLITADGLSGTTSGSGGGSGGSIWITAQRLDGSGTFSANGGEGESNRGGGGGGGRITLEIATNQFAGVTRALGGAGFQRGGAGMIFQKTSGNTNGLLLVENGGSSGASTLLTDLNTPALEVGQGAVVVVGGAQTIASLTVRSNGWLSCPSTAVPLTLTVIGDAKFWKGSGVNALGKGFVSGAGFGAGAFFVSGTNFSGGGAGHGGYGGSGLLSNARGGNYYENPNTPAVPGSGGGGNPAYPGGSGGGAVRLTVLGMLELDGSIIADGTAPVSDVAGGGSGGGVWLDVGTLMGEGQISANGGSVLGPNGGGGSGGRIALYFDMNNFSGRVTALGGSGFQYGAAGTIYTRSKGAEIAQVVVDNGGNAGTNTFVGATEDVDLKLQEGGAVGLPGGVLTCQNLLIGSNSLLTLTGQTLTVMATGDVYVARSGAINLSGRGYPGNSGPQPGGEAGSPQTGGGGGNGGYGGLSSSNAPGGTSFGSIEMPVSPGSGGGAGVSGVGGAGGGAIRLIASGNVIIDGALLAHGSNATNSRSGGGAGGSVWITSQTLAGSGLIAANGGNGEPIQGGGGGGGRIALEFGTNQFTGVLQALGGVGFQRGGAGTIYTKAEVEPSGTLLVENGGNLGGATMFASSYAPALIVGPGGLILPNGTRTVKSLVVHSNGWLSCLGTPGTLTSLTVLEDAWLAQGGGINVKGKGNTYGQGLGPGTFNSTGGMSAGGGGGHAGFGGMGSLISQSRGGNYYDVLTGPTLPGSGGGGTSLYPGGPGGGVVRLDVNGLLQLDGSIDADGERPSSSVAGGGSGGSVWLTVNALGGSGRVSANGGSASGPAGGGGSGGRIAVTWSESTFTGTMRAAGGTGYQNGAAGTIYTRVNGSNIGQVVLDNGNHMGTNTVLQTTEFVDLVLRGGSMAGGVINFRNLTIGSNSSLVLSGASQTLTITGDATIERGGSLSMNGLGYAYNQGYSSGAGAYYSAAQPSCGGGGAHGGHGGYGMAGSTYAREGLGYDNFSAPIYAGSGGGGTSTYPGGSGGGVLNLTVNGLLKLDGRISSDGSSAYTGGAGGGAGGSVRLTLNRWTGNGVISATGGDGDLPYGGGGGGGRIAINYQSNAFAGVLTARGGNGYLGGGAGTIYLKPTTSPYGSLTLDNGGMRGAYSPAPTGSPAFDLALLGGAALVNGANLGLRTLFISSNSWWHLSGTTVQYLSVSSNVVIEAEGGISGDGAGYETSPALYYANASYPYRNSGAGAGHGGDGGNGAWGGSLTAGGPGYGTLSGPTSAGAGGGGNTTYPGGYGGSVLRLSVGGLFQLDGRISMDAGSASSGGAGGGAGGGIWLLLNQWAGNGVISANGGAGDAPNGGGGGGGRIAISYTSNAYTGIITAYGGKGFVAGGAGTIFLKSAADPQAEVIIDNNQVTGAGSFLNSSGPFDLILRAGGRVSTNSSAPVTLRNLWIGSNAWASFRTATVNSNAIIASGGGLSVEGGGYRAGQGYANGAGRYYSSSPNSNGGGGGHGGFGGNGLYGGVASTGGGVNDTALTQPVTGGSGGGSYSASTESSGGGVMRLTVIGTLDLDGVITANGLPGLSQGSGGGAGGSLWLTVGKLFGSGAITAEGGDGEFPNGGGGGGGRIALYYTSNLFAGTISAKGGTGSINGGPGTIFFKDSRQLNGQLVVDGQGERGTNTVIYPVNNSDLIVKGGATAIPAVPMDFVNLVVQPDSAILVSNQQITISGNATIEAGGRVYADGKGYGPGLGSGAGSNGLTPKGGGSHGGLGGANPLAMASGLVVSPTTWGSGGGNGSGTSAAPYGGSGGALVRLNVLGTLTVDGSISANGADGNANSGGGAGGSVWLTARTLAGKGMIAANGGMGNGTAGSGGGGRVSIQFRTNLYAGSAEAFGGIGSAGGGAGTVYWEETDTPNKWLLLDNGGWLGTNTPLFSLPSGLKLTVANSAIAYPQNPFPLLNSMNIAEGGQITCLATQSKLEVPVLSDLNIEPGGALTVLGKGYPRGGGIAPGMLLSSEGGGGGYGGAGGASASGAAGGHTYGSELQPIDRGSGGGATYPGGSEGGGAIRLSVGGTLNVRGSLSANGNDGWSDNAGGGAGGSIWATAGVVSGDGAISANGGAGELFNGGGGGGGRIALYSPSNTHIGLVTTLGGAGAHRGDDGTVVFSTNVPGFEVSSYSPTGMVDDVVGTLFLTFTEIVNPGSVSPEDFVLITPLGQQTNLTATPSGPFTVSIQFPVQNLPGDYRFEAGPNLENLFGQPLSQVYTGTFTVMLPTISGKVTDTNGAPVPDVVLQPDGGWLPAITDTNGVYTLPVPLYWTGLVTPSLGSSVFVPAARAYSSVTQPFDTEDYLVVDTIAPQLTSGSTGTNMFLNWYGIPGVWYQVLGSTNLTDWYTVGPAIQGTNGLIEITVPVGEPPEQFFRMQANN